jgi:phosphatidate cytidylyltransferase
MKRIITSLLITALLFAAIYLNPIFWLLFICIFSVGSGIEFTNVLYKGKLWALRILVILACLLFPINAYLQETDLFNLPDMLLVAMLFVLAPVLFILSKGAVDDFHTSVPMAIFGALWCGLLLSFHIHIRFLKLENMPYGPQAIFLFMIIITASDVGAYYTGKTIGRHKMSPLYSPNKTWEGSIGGFVFAVLAAYLCYFIWAQKFALIHTGIIAIVVTGVGQIGDLAESIFKRSCNVKDAGEVLPGHGGILDRIDSLLLASPIFYWYVYFVLG